MRVSRFLTFALILFITLSCNPDENDFSKQDLHGIWELSSYQEETQLFLVEAYEFKEDGTFEVRTTARQQDSTVDIGYISVNRGTFILAGDRLRLIETEFLTLPEGSTTWYSSLENLVGSNLDYNREIDISISMKERKSQMAMDFPCPPNAYCIGQRTYYRVWK